MIQGKKVRTASNLMIFGSYKSYHNIPTRMGCFFYSSRPWHPSAAARFSERTLRLKLRLRVFRSCWLVVPRYVAFVVQYNEDSPIKLAN